MKTLISALLLFFSFISAAQNYNCFRPDRKNHFINGDNYVRGIRIDSVGVSGTDTIYYPYRSRRISHYLPGSTSTTDTVAGSWLGGNVVRKPNGTFIFDNVWDTVFIKTQAHTGDSWMFFNDTTDINYIATVTAEDTMTVSGMLDSIKKITITADSGGMVNTFDPVNNFQIILSKHSGFVQIFDLYTFPYHYPHYVGYGRYHGYTYQIRNFDWYLDVVLGNLGTCDLGCTDNLPDTINSVFHLFPFHNPQRMEIYDYSLGDVYESFFTVYGMIPGPVHEEYFLDSVTGKTAGAYDVTYTGSQHTKTIDYDASRPGTTTTSYSIGTFGASGDTSLLIYGMPEEWRGSFLLHYFLSDNGFPSCQSRASYKIDEDFMGTGFGYTGISYLPSYRYQVYTIGLGMSAQVDFRAVSLVTQQTNYTFYQKDSVACGSFVDAIPATAGINSMEAKNIINISPIPASDYFEIKTIKPFSSGTIISAFDMTGKRVFQSAADFQNVLNVSTSHWSAGIYLLIIQDNSGVIKKEKVIVDR
jgi:Secretion system C-terminal sorting domain